MTDKEKRYWAYFLNVNGKIEYYEQCKKCVHSCKQRRLSDEQREVRNGHLVQQIVIWCSELTITNAFSDIINKICDWK